MPTLQSVSNFLVPATGSTNAYQLHQEFDTIPTFVDFSQVGLSGIPFRPSGVIIDNTKGTDILSVLINEMSFVISCPAGSALQMPFPAPVGCTANVTGSGEVATVVFVDYPVIPYVFSSASGSNNVNVTGTVGLTDAQLRATPVSILVETSATEQTASLLNVTTAGTVAAGAHSVSFANIGAADATVAGGTLKMNQAVSFEATLQGILGAIAYDATGTELLISEVI